MNGADVTREVSSIYRDLVIERIRLEYRLAESQDQGDEEHF